MPDAPAVAAPASESAFAKVMSVVTNPTVRRLFVFLLGFLTVALNKKFGLDLDANAMVTDALLVLGYIGQSAYTDASKARSDALVTAAAPRPQ